MKNIELLKNNLFDGLEHLLTKAQKDPEFQTTLSQIAQTMTELCQAFTPTAKSLEKVVDEEVPESELASPENIRSFVANFDLTKPNKAGGSTKFSKNTKTAKPLTLEQVIANCQLKARACNWLAKHGFTENKEVLEERRQLNKESNSAQKHHLWMLDNKKVCPYNTEKVRQLAESYQLVYRWFTFMEEI